MLEKECETLRAQPGYWAARAAGEITYAANLAQAYGKDWKTLLTNTAETLLSGVAENGVIGKTDTLRAEAMLAPIAAEAKALRVICVGHAHIDMNWMWGFHETASVTVDTFRTMLDLMEEYPGFTFAQSQGSTYQIIEEFAPAMLDEIRARVKEGRWEVTASTWVEPDKNMPDGESQVRHILYTRQYLSKLLNIPAESLDVDFEPDTFGHNISVPEILSEGGVKYYYHCRGDLDPYCTRWRARSGKEILCYREPKWYNADVNYDFCGDLPFFCKESGLSVMMRVYGVGDHGGGPTRRDIDRILDMRDWPIYPTVEFGTFRDFFREMEKAKESLPFTVGEKNALFTGCYTTQTRIKTANRAAEARMRASEALNAASVLCGGNDATAITGKAWQSILFNHFHDILPGSGVRETREYAMGQFQRAMSAAAIGANSAMRHLASRMDVTPLRLSGYDHGADRGQGAGVGYGVDMAARYQMPSAERGGGIRRAYHLFNTTAFAKDGVSVLTVWDWNADANRAVFTDENGKVLPSQILASGQGYWGHRYHRFAVQCVIPSMGYTTVVLDAASAPAAGFNEQHEPRLDTFSDDDRILENSKIKAVFDRRTMELISLTDKETDKDKELIGAPSGYFNLNTESTVYNMTAWRVGPYMRVENLNETRPVKVTASRLGGIRQTIDYEMPIGTRSFLHARVILAENSRTLEWETRVEWHELGTQESGIPQLAFAVPFAGQTKTYRYDVPFGTIDRAARRQDLPALSYVAALPAVEHGPRDAVSLMLTTDCKYGFRCADNCMAVTLIRSSYDPDPEPEEGTHHMRLGLIAVPDTKNATLDALAEDFLHPASVASAIPGKKTEGKALPLSGSFLRAEGVRLGSVKMAEDGEGIILRLSDIEGKGGVFTLTFAGQPVSACLCDLCEKNGTVLPLAGNAVRGEIGRYEMISVRVKF